jgi:MFS transporter, DHA1 family, multidrug resistance protein
MQKVLAKPIDAPHRTQMDSPAPNSAAAQPKADIGERELVVMMASLMALNALAIDAMLPAFPRMVAGLRIADPNHVQYVISVFLAGTGIGALFHGPLSDRFGRKPVLVWAVVASAIFSFACSFSSSFEMLITMRFLHGLCAAAASVLVASIIRDKFEGDAMAKKMSMIFLVFMIVPIIAPTLGQFVLLFAGWRSIFDVMAFMCIAAALWAIRRLPETLKPENVIPIELKPLTRAWKTVVLNRGAAGYMLGAGIVQGALFGFLNSSQQAFDKVFGAAEFFTTGFAIVALGIAVSNFTNARIVERFGARRVSHAALVLFITLGLLQLAAAIYAPKSMPLFLLFLTCNMAMIGFIGSNFSSIAMTPFGAMAGAASSFQTFTKTVVGALIGASIGQQFNGSIVPMASGFVVCGLVALALVAWSEKGRLFTRPGTTIRVPHAPRS